MEQRRVDRIQNPNRFNITPSVAEQAVRKPPPQSTAYDESSDMKVKDFTLSLSITISSEPPISTYSHFVFF